MLTGDSVCQNRCRMQGICVVGGCSNTECVRIEYSSSFNTSLPVKLDQKRERPKKWADLCEAKSRKPSRISSISGSPLLQKPRDFYKLHILLYLWWKA